MDEGANGLMADTLITGTTIVESSSRSDADVPIGGIIEWDDSVASLPVAFVECNGATVSDPLSPYNGVAVPNLNTEYITINSNDWITGNINSDDVSGNFGSRAATGSIIILNAPLNLPNGATITACIVNGNPGASAETWTLRRVQLDSVTADTLATANFDTEDTTISNGVIDNENYSYSLGSSSIDAGDTIYSAKITLTPRLKFAIRIR